ncbi:hypothetical protein PTKIN_Ptkin06aG0217800 [Pterospermum kingtungense]
MKTVLLVLFFLGLVLLHCQADAKRFLLDDKTKKTGREVASDSDAKPDDQPSKSGAAEKPVVASGPASNGSNDQEERNNSYGAYGNPSGSSTDTHHYYTSDHPPAKGH